MDDDLEGGPSDTDELPSVMDSNAPSIEVAIPRPPSTGFREAATLPPGPEDTGEWTDPLEEDPMKHAPPWGRNLHDRFEALRELVTAALDPETGFPALRAGLVSDLSAWLRPHIDEFMRVIAVQEKAVVAIGDAHDKLEVRVRDLERVDADKRLVALEKQVRNLVGDGR